MPPKKAKKSKKEEQEALWEAKEKASGFNSTVGSPAPPLEGSDEEDHYNSQAKGKKKKNQNQNTFDLGGEDDINVEGEEEDGGGLMGAIRRADAAKQAKTNKKKTTKIKEEESDHEGDVDKLKVEDTSPLGAESLHDTTTRQQPVDGGAITVEAGDLFAEDSKPKKSKKKGKHVQKHDDVEEDDDVILERARLAREEVELATVVSNNQVEEEDVNAGETKVLSKKEKEKLKKEREKAKKKAQAAATKKTTETAIVNESEQVVLLPTTRPDNDEQDESEGEVEAEGGASKNKKKKKKKGAATSKDVPEEKEEHKKKGGKINALRAALEEKNRLIALAKAKEDEEERLRKEEEDHIEAEEKRKEEEKAKKKEKEKAKKEELRKAGKLLTPKQKAEKAAAEARLAALVASGVQVAGLADRSGSSTATPPGSKKPAYGKRPTGKGKKDPLATKAGEVIEAPVPARPATPQPAVKEQPPPVQESIPVEADDGVKDSWDAESEEEVKADWEAESEEEKPESVQVVDQSTKKAAASKGGKPSAAPVKVDKTSTTSKAVAVAGSGKARSAPVETESSDEDASSSEDNDDEDDEDDDDDSSSEEDSSDEDDSDDSEDDRQAKRERVAAQKKAESTARRKQRFDDARAAGSAEDMRSPICCILGHVDTGKTKLLDKIRQTNVQEGEAGGITQQIGATFFPMDSIRQKTRVLAEHDLDEYKLPGLLVIDTPGHESFTNLRSRGSSLCNIAILVVDIMHGLEPQTLESLRLLRDRKAPFIVALNKIDRLYGWKAIKDNSFRSSFESQVRPVQREFETRLEGIMTAFQEQGLNAEPYYKNSNFAKIVSIVPTSAITGEGIPDLLMLLIKLTQERMTKDLMYLSEVECTVLEVKVIEGLGTTIDVVLSNGVLREGDKIVICGLNGPIVTQIRALLTPQPLKELRIKGSYVHHKEVKAALGIKISAPDLEKAIAGSRLLLVTDDDEEEDLKAEVMGDLTDLMSNIDKSGKGVCVQASTLGSLEALLDFLKSSNIPVCGINIGPVFKRDVMKAGTMLQKAKEFAVLLAFDVPIDKEAERLADELGVKVFKADIIYHLFDAFKAYNQEIMEAKRADSAPIAVWPCRLKIIAVFAKRDPIIVGCDIIEGTLRVGTPLCVIKTDAQTGKRTTYPLGKVTSLEINHKPMQVIKKEQAGAGIAVKVEHAVYQNAMTYGRQFDDKDDLISLVSRQSIDVLKEVFRAEVSNDEWLLIKRLKKDLDIS